MECSWVSDQRKILGEAVCSPSTVVSNINKFEVHAPKRLCDSMDSTLREVQDAKPQADAEEPRSGSDMSPNSRDIAPIIAAPFQADQTIFPIPPVDQPASFVLFNHMGQQVSFNLNPEQVQQFLAVASNNKQRNEVSPALNNSPIPFPMSLPSFNPGQFREEQVFPPQLNLVDGIELATPGEKKIEKRSVPEMTVIFLRLNRHSDKIIKPDEQVVPQQRVSDIKLFLAAACLSLNGKDTFQPFSNARKFLVWRAIFEIIARLPSGKICSDCLFQMLSQMNFTFKNEQDFSNNYISPANNYFEGYIDHYKITDLEFRSPPKKKRVKWIYFNLPKNNNPIYPQFHATNIIYPQVAAIDEQTNAVDEKPEYVPPIASNQYSNSEEYEMAKLLLAIGKP